MTTSELLKNYEQSESAIREINTKLAEQMETILEEAESSREAQQPKALQWSYQVPMAGVRYYSF